MERIYEIKTKKTNKQTDKQAVILRGSAMASGFGLKTPLQKVGVGKKGLALY